MEGYLNEVLQYFRFLVSDPKLFSDDDPENAKHEFAFDNPAFKGKIFLDIKSCAHKFYKHREVKIKDFDDRLRKETHPSLPYKLQSRRLK